MLGHVQAQGREGDHRHGAQGAQEAGGGLIPADRRRPGRRPPPDSLAPCASCCSPARAASARRPRPPRRRRSLAAAARPQDPGAVHRPGALARRRVRRAARPGRRPRSSRRLPGSTASRSTPSARFEQLARGAALPAVGARAGRRRPARGGGADRAARRRGGAGAAGGPRPGRVAGGGTWSSSTARRPRRRCGCWRCPRRSAGTSTGCSPSSAGWCGRCGRCSPGSPAVPMPHDERVRGGGAAARRAAPRCGAVLTDPASTSVRLVLTPEAVVVAEARRTLTSLALYGYRVDGVVANRVFPRRPAATRGGQGWVDAQAEQLAEVDASFAPLPVRRAPYRAAEPVGLAALAELGRRDVRRRRPAARRRRGPSRCGWSAHGDEFVLVARAAARRQARDRTWPARATSWCSRSRSHRRVLALPSRAAPVRRRGRRAARRPAAGALRARPRAVDAP